MQNSSLHLSLLCVYEEDWGKIDECSSLVSLESFFKIIKEIKFIHIFEDYDLGYSHFPVYLPTLHYRLYDHQR